MPAEKTETSIAVLKTEFSNMEEREKSRARVLHEKIESITNSLDKKTDKIHQDCLERIEQCSARISSNQAKLNHHDKANIVFAVFLVLLLISQVPELGTLLKLFPII